MKKIHCQLNIPSNSLHLHQIITGFLLLELSGDISLTINFDPSMTNRMPAPHIMEAIINDEIIVAYDVLDGYNFDVGKVREYLNKVDFYFKRSFSESLNQTYGFKSNIYPLGFNYSLVMDHKIFRTLAGGTFIGTAQSLVRGILGKVKPINFTEFEDVPKDSSVMNVLFTTRTWEPSKELPSFLNEEREYINEMRAKCIRVLRKELGSHFTGGLSPSDYSVEKFPDCVLPAQMTKKKNFMKLVKNTDICITTMGLHGSNGWKIGEYVAASKAILAEELVYTVPGNFMKGRNYEEFVAANDCVERTLELTTDKDRTYQMKYANYDYYTNYLRPNSLVYNSILTALNGIIVNTNPGVAVSKQSVETVH